MSEKGKQRKISRLENVRNPEQIIPKLLLLRKAAKLSGGVEIATSVPLLQAYGEIKSEETVTDSIIAFKKATELKGSVFPKSDPYVFNVAESEEAAADFIAKREKMRNPNMADRRLLVTEMAARLSGVTLKRALQLLGKNERS